MCRPVLIALLLALAVPGVASANPATQIIVKRDAGLSAAERADIRADADVRLVRSLPLPRTEVVAAAPGDVDDALRDLNADPDVVYAERDRQIRAFDDPGFEFMWGLENTRRPVRRTRSTTPTPMSRTRGTTAPAPGSGSRSSTRAPTWTTPTWPAQLVGGYDYVDDNGTPEDENGHGTHVSGTIAAVKDNNVGVVGVAPDAQVAPLRVLDDQGQGLVSDAVLAYDDAWPDEGARIVNASLGGDDPVQAEYDAIDGQPQRALRRRGGELRQQQRQARPRRVPLLVRPRRTCCAWAPRSRTTGRRTSRTTARPPSTCSRPATTSCRPT